MAIFDRPSRDPLPEPTFEDVKHAAGKGLVSLVPGLGAASAVQATQTALRTHLEEKLKALKNAVVNVALGKEPDPDRQQQFRTLVDRFSDTHLVVLKFLNDPASHFQRRGEPGQPQSCHGKDARERAYRSRREEMSSPNTSSMN